MTSLFEIAGGSVSGRDHVLAGRNNQDAFSWAELKGITVAIVCDGCSSQPHSEVGAQLGSRLLAEAVLFHLSGQGVAGYRRSESIWKAIREDFDFDLGCITPDPAIGEIWPDVPDARREQERERRRFVLDYLLFTCVGVAITPVVTFCFSVGDGFLNVNGTTTQLGPFPDNEPPYLAYRLLSRNPDVQRRTRFRLERFLTSDLTSVLLGTDGVSDFLQHQNDREPGQHEAVGPLSQFWTDDRYFANPDLIRRKLVRVNRDARTLDQEGGLVHAPGLLPDDTTIVVLRRRPS